MKFGKPKEEVKETPSVPKVVNRPQLGKAANQAIQVILAEKKNIRDVEVQKDYKNLVKTFYAMDDVIEAEILKGE